MSSVYWVNEQLTAATIDSSGNLVVGDASPADIIGHTVFQLMAEDATLRGFFGGATHPRMDRIAMRQAVQYADYPRLQVYSWRGEEGQRPTKLTEMEIDCWVGTLERAEDLRPMSSFVFGATSHTLSLTQDSLHHKIQQILRKNRQLTVQIDGVEVDIARNSEALQAQPFPEYNNAGGLLHYRYETGWRYRIHVDQISGKIEPIERAGG